MKTKELRNREFSKQQEKCLIKYKRYSIRSTDDFSSETMKPKKEWDDIFKVLKEEQQRSQPRILSQNYPSKMKAKLRNSQINVEGCIASRPALSES